ncbi:MAG TPA: ABC transporter permease subunit [Tepidisphaeraceae bacterium]|nr:ABC transporter permease subunit [Tepidisphaeraceae bacterium]
MKMKKWLIDSLLLPLIGVALLLGLWAAASALSWNEKLKKSNLPSPAQTWRTLEVEIGEGETEPKHYITRPFAYRGEQDQGVLRFTWYSLLRVAKGYALALAVGVPIGFLLGASTLFRRSFDLIIQILRPVSPLAWLPLLQLFFTGFYQQGHRFDVNEWAAVFTVAICAMWPTVLNTAVGVRAIPQDYLNVARVLKLSRTKTLFKILLPAAMPYMFTGFRLSLGIAWLVIVAAEMLSGKVGIGGFLNNAGYQSAKQEYVIMGIVVIGIVGFILDRLMSLVEANVTGIAAFPGAVRRWFGALRAPRMEPVPAT